MLPGSGPRHIAFDPKRNFVYVLNELTSTVSTFSFDTKTGGMKAGATISTLPMDFDGENTTAEIVIDAKGKFLYVSNRGDNSIAQFSINEQDGNLIPVAWIPSGGEIPRNFEVDPSGHWLLAANQNSGNITIFQIDQSSGKLTQHSTDQGIISPVCVRFIALD
jgi:6-phosphogluconolactonase